MKKFNLAQLNPNVEYWSVLLHRWKKDLKCGKENKKSGRCPVYGWEIDNKLAAAVEKYNLYGVPLTDHILKLTLLDILKIEDRQDILNRICPDDEDITISKGDASQLRFGKKWAHRFLK